MATEPIDWRQLLATELARLGGSKQALATRLGWSRPYVSRVMNPDGKSGYQHPHPNFVARVIERLHVVTCPATRQETRRDECAKANDPAPIHNPLAVQRWRKCQTCPHRPAKKGGAQ